MRDKGLNRGQWIAIILAVSILAWYTGVITIPGVQRPGQITPPTIPGAPVTPPTGVVRQASGIQFSLHNVVNDASISSANSFVDVQRVGLDGTFSFMNKVEQITVNSDPEQSAQTYAQGDVLILHTSSDIDPTGGTDYYDAWYYVRLVEGEQVRKLTPSVLSAVQNSPTYKYTITGVGESTGFIVQYTSGTTNYWGIGVIGVTPRTTAANLDTYLTLGGTTLSSVTDGSTWDTSAGSPDATFATRDEKLWIKLDAGATNVAYGTPMYTISSIGKFEERKTFIIMSTTMTGIGTQKLLDKGWKAISDGTLYAEKAFYKAVPAQVPTKGNKFTVDIELPVDSTAATASTTYTFRIWVIDFQLEDNLAIGSVSTTVPTAYGMVGEYGIDAIIFARAYSTSSGAGANQVLIAGIATST